MERERKKENLGKKRNVEREMKLEWQREEKQDIAIFLVVRVLSSPFVKMGAFWNTNSRSC